MAGGCRLLLLTTAAAFVASPASALPRPNLETSASLAEEAATAEEDELKRPLKVFTLYDRKFVRIAKVWRDCLTKAIPRPFASMSVEATEIAPKGVFLLQNERRRHRGRFTAKAYANLLLNEWATKLTAFDALHVDADAFLLRDPARGTTLQYPEADVIAAADCAADRHGCTWYRSHDYMQRHHGEDPLEAQGFMLSIGFMYLRSLPATMHLLNRSIAMTDKGENEQVAVNEALLALRCTWMTPDGFPAPRGAAAQRLLVTSSLHGVCSAGVGMPEEPQPELHVVVLPYSAVPRHGRGAVGPENLAYHPSGRLEEKERDLGIVRRLCKV